MVQVSIVGLYGVTEVNLNFLSLFRKRSVEPIVGPCFLTVSIPPSTAGIMLERLSIIAPEVSVIARPL